MTDLAEIIHHHERVLREKGQVSLNCNSFLSAHPRESELPHPDLQIHQAIEELRRLKAEHIELRTKELFMKTILTATSLDDLPTSQETGRAEVKLQEEKRNLRKIKARRAKAEENLVEAVGDLGNTLRDQRDATQEAELRLRQARIALKALDVNQVLGNRDVTQIESLVKDIDDLDAPTCRSIIGILREERGLLERSANQKSAEVENLRKEVEELENDVENMTTESRRLKEKIAEEDQRNPSVAKARHESMLQKEVESILAALTGVRVVEIRENGISLDLNAWLFVPFQTNVDRSKSTHTLDIELKEEDSEEAYVSRMVIRPADIEVSDLCNGRGISLNYAVQTVCSRLAEHASEVC